MIFFYTIVSSQENSVNPEIVEQMYRRNPILRYTQHPLHAPLLPLPYGEVTSCEWNRETSYAPNFLFHRKLKRPKKPTQKSVKWSKSSVIGWKTGYTQEGSPADHRTNIELDKDKLTDPQPELELSLNLTSISLDCDNNWCPQTGASEGNLHGQPQGEHADNMFNTLKCWHWHNSHPLM